MRLPKPKPKSTKIDRSGGLLEAIKIAEEHINAKPARLTHMNRVWNLILGPK
jgi:hypothetical protein